jgi:hypothetical protein
MSQEMINGLKMHVKKGYSRAEFWGDSYMKSLVLHLKSWKMIENKEEVAKLAWETVGHYAHYRAIESSRLGFLSKIGEMIIPEKTYTNKKGITKTTPEQVVPAHYTHDGRYIGRVAILGEKPISYPMQLQITPEHFDFIEVGETLEGCFQLKDKVWDGCNVKVKDASKADLKAERKAKK